MYAPELVLAFTMHNVLRQQIATGDSWSSVIVRGLMDTYGEDTVSAGLVGLYFVSYVLIVGVVLMNIVVGTALAPHPLLPNPSSRLPPAQSTILTSLSFHSSMLSSFPPTLGIHPLKAGSPARCSLLVCSDLQDSLTRSPPTALLLQPTAVLLDEFISTVAREKMQTEADKRKGEEDVVQVHV